MKNLKDFSLKNKKVLVRCDFNLSFNEKGKILDGFRVEAVIPTIDFLIDKGAKVILISHLGRPLRSSKPKSNFTLKPVASKLKELLNKEVKFLNDCLGKKVEKEVDKMKPGEVVLLENLRFYKGERENSPEFAKKLSKLADLYINDAFSASHREHASIVRITDYLPSGAGFLFKKEIKALSKVKEINPLSIIIGGAKVETKIALLKSLLELGDHLMLGGLIANIILRVKGISIGKPLPKKEIMQEIKKINLTSTKLHLPIDVVVSPDMNGKTYTKKAGPGAVLKEELILDVGPETIEIFSKIIRESKIIIWNGPMGVYEKKKFENGTKNLADAIVRNYRAFTIAGGGDTISALSKFGLRDKFDHLSTGGGAMLAFLSKGTLPGIKALEAGNK